MATKSKYQAQIISGSEAEEQLSKLRAQNMNARTSKFDPLKQHIQWLGRGQVLRIEEMTQSDVPNLRSFIERNIILDDKNSRIVVRSSRIDGDSDRYRVYVFKEDGK